jgi:hypothetical protein
MAKIKMMTGTELQKQVAASLVRRKVAAGWNQTPNPADFTSTPAATYEGAGQMTSSYGTNIAADKLINGPAPTEMTPVASNVNVPQETNYGTPIPVVPGQGRLIAGVTTQPRALTALETEAANEGNTVHSRLQRLAQMRAKIQMTKGI